MLRINLFLAVLVLALMGWFAQFTSTPADHTALVVIGGEYTVQPGELRQGDVYVLFAQVNIEAGGQASGDIHALASDLKVNGVVSGNIDSWFSDINIGKLANIAGQINSTGFHLEQMLVPSILLVVS